MKTIKRIILIGIALILVLGVGLYVGIRIALPPAKIREFIHVKGSEALGRSVDVGGIDVRLFPRLELVVNDVIVANAPGFSSDPAIKLGEMHLSLSLMSVIRMAPVIDQIKLVYPEILYEVNSSGHNNLEGLGKPDTVKKEEKPLEIPVALVLKSFVIVDGKVRYRDMQSGREISLGNIHQDMSLSIDPHFQNVTSTGILEIAEISARDSATGLSRGDLHISVTHDIQLNLADQILKLNKIELAFQDIHAQIEGSVSHFRSKAPEVDMRVSAPSISLASVLKEVPASLSPDVPKLRMSGQASLQAHVQGKLDSGSIPDVNAVFQIHNGTVGHSDVPLGVEHLEMNVSMHDDSLRLAQLAFDMGQNPVRVAALITKLRAKVPRLENLAVDAALDLGSLAALAQRMGFMDKTMSLSGTETIKLQASGPLDPAHPQGLTAAGTAELKGIAISIPGKPRVQLNGKATITNERIQEQIAAMIGKSDVTLSGEVSNYLALVFPKQAAGNRTHVKVDVHSALVDLDELMPPPDRPVGAVREPPLQAYPDLPPVDADVSVNLDRTRLLGLEMTKFQMQAGVRAKDIKVDMKGSVYSGSFSSSLGVVPKDAKDMEVALKLNVAGVEANDFISRLNKRVPLKNKLFKSVAQQTDSLIYGKLNLNANLTTHGLPDQFSDNLSGTIFAALVDGKIMESGLTRNLSAALSKINPSLVFHQLNVGILKADLQAEKGNLLVRDFHFESSAIGAMQAQGKIGFDNALDLNVTQALPPAASKVVTGASGALTGQLARYAPGMANVSLVPMDKSGRALLYFLVGGTLTQPSFALDAKRMASEGAGSVKTALQDALRQKENELKARVEAEKQKLEAEAKARYEVEKKKAVDAAKQKAQSEVKKQGTKILKGLGL